MADNYDDALDQLRAVGLEVDSIVLGRIVRCRADGDRRAQKSGWYSLHEITTQTGERLLVGACGNWRAGVDINGKPQTHRITIKGRKMSGDERAAIRQRIAAEAKAAETRRQVESDRAARRAQAAWSEMRTSGESSYLSDKGVAGYGVRYSEAGNLVIPLHDNLGVIRGLQVIYSDPAVIKRKGRNKDFWPVGVGKRGNYFLIGAVSWLCLVAEGYATAATLHEATGLPVAVAFDAGNLLPVCQAIRKRYKTAKVLVCADDDYKTEGNPGVQAANTAALAVSGAFIVPKFSDENGRKRAGLTDFNDLHQAEHIDAVRTQLEAKIAELGWTAGASSAGTSSGEAGAPWLFSLDDLLRDYALIYGTETVYDGVRRIIVSLSSLRSAAGKSLVRMWLEHPGRRLVMPDQVVFDPAHDQDDPSVCNLYDGWPTVPGVGSCDQVLELLEYLCSAEDKPDEVYNWILNWCAYPIQNPGAKMQTALLVHGGEGTGKNTFFGAVRAIYGRYGNSIGQMELESQFNAWAMNKLFIVANEVVTRAELYHLQGRLKTMITESEWSINDKHLPVRTEQNHCNFVFFSNRIDIAKLDKDDRRYCVVWTPPALSQDFMTEVYEELHAGGVQALHQFLADRDLGDFKPWTKPPITRAKRELIELGLDSVDRFYRDWRSGTLPVPFAVVRSEDIYDTYRFWAQRHGIPKPAPAHVLAAALVKKPDVDRRRCRHYKRQKIVQSTFYWPAQTAPPDPATQNQWLEKQIEAYQNALNDWREGLF